MSDDKELRMDDLTSRFNVKRWTIHRWVRDLGFPPGVTYPGSKGKVWPKSKVDQWEDASRLPLEAARQ